MNNKWIIQTILLNLFNNTSRNGSRFESIEHFIIESASKPNIREYIYIHKDFLNRINYSMRGGAIEYALVCKQWFELIVKLFCSVYYIDLRDFKLTAINNDIYDYQSTNIEIELARLQKAHSFYRFETIRNLYLNLSFTYSQTYFQDEIDGLRTELCEHFLPRFNGVGTELEQVTLFVDNFDNTAFAKDIINRLPSNVKVNIFFIINLTSPDQLDQLNTIELLPHHSLGFINLQIFNRIPNISQYCIENHINFKSINSIQLHHTEDSDELFMKVSIESLKHLTIGPLSSFHDLDYLFDYYNRIETFKATLIPCSSKNTSRKECLCKKDLNTTFVESNKMEYWDQFCQKLARNCTLKRLYLTTNCNISSSYDTKAKYSSSLALAIAENITLESLSIDCCFLNHTFFEALRSNVSIWDLSLMSCSPEDIQSLLSSMIGNITITHLNLLGFKHQFDNNSGSSHGILSSLLSDYEIAERNSTKTKLIEGFIKMLTKNNTLQYLYLNNNNSFTREVCLSLKRSLASKIKTINTNNYTNISILEFNSNVLLL